MRAEDINHLLNMQFQHYDYRLNNSFIFAWESDFLCQSQAGYWVECEVKVTRSDFFRDFEKPKHRLFQRIRECVTHYVEDRGKTQGDFICRYRWAELINGSGYDHRYRKKGAWGWMQLTQDCDQAFLQWHTEIIMAPATRINIRPLAECRCPHQFYFAVPAGLVKLEEVPDYAGLIYIDDTANIVRRAPYLHKAKMDLRNALLKKYYNLWRFKSGGDMDRYYECLKLRLL